MKNIVSLRLMMMRGAEKMVFVWVRESLLMAMKDFFL